MIVTPDTRPFDFAKSDLVRSTGLHASDIYGDLYKFLEPDRYDYGDAPPNSLLMAMGTAWEKHFEYLVIANGIDAVRPGEFVSPEGVAYSPDLLIFDADGTPRVGEIKLTSMSLDQIPDEPVNELPVKLDKYLTQIKLYTYWLEWSHAWLAIVSIRKPWAPQYRAFDLEFTQQELVENYRMLMTHAKHKGMTK